MKKVITLGLMLLSVLGSSYDEFDIDSSYDDLGD